MRARLQAQSPPHWHSPYSLLSHHPPPRSSAHPTSQATGLGICGLSIHAAPESVWFTTTPATAQGPVCRPARRLRAMAHGQWPLALVYIFRARRRSATAPCASAVPAQCHRHRSARLCPHHSPLSTVHYPLSTAHCPPHLFTSRPSRAARPQTDLHRSQCSYRSWHRPQLEPEQLRRQTPH